MKRYEGPVEKAERTLRDYCPGDAEVADLVVGLTGNPGAGKSTAARFMCQKGAIILDGDQLGYEMLQTHSPVYQDIVQAFGSGIVNERGEIDRAKIGSIVFHDSKQLDRLNRIVHPPMLQRIQEQIQQFRYKDSCKEKRSAEKNSEKRQNTIRNTIRNEKRQEGPLVLDAALIFEWGIEEWFDAVIVVAAPQRERHQRYIEHKGGTSEQLNLREAAQISEEIKINRADIIIWNEEDESTLQDKINRLFV